MKVVFAALCFAAFVAVTDAGASFPEADGEVCSSTAGSTTAPALIPATQFGGKSCFSATGSTESVMGLCENNLGQFRVQTWNASTTCAGTPSSTDYITLPSASTGVPFNGALTVFHSCNKCPPSNIANNTHIYIISFFCIVTVYLLLVCAGMWALFNCGWGCEM